MANNIKKNLTRVQQEYKELAQSVEPPRPILKNFLRAFIAGGTICMVGQAIQEMFVHWGGFDEKKAGDPTVSVPIFSIASLVLSIKLGSFGTFLLALPSNTIGDLLLAVLIRCLNCDLSSLFSIFYPFHLPFSEYVTDIIPIFISFIHHRSQ